MTEAGKKLIGTKCPFCKIGTLKKKYNRRVKPAKPFIGCDRYPKCDCSYEIDGSKPKFEDNEEFHDYFDDHPHSSVALGQF